MVAPVFDVLCVGLACVDLTLEVPHHPAPDEKLRATSRLVAPGGPAAVASAQIARLGGRAAFAGLLGDDTFAGLLRAAFVEEGIDTAALTVASGHETPLAAILVKPDATRSVLSHRPTPPAEFVTNLVTNTPKTHLANNLSSSANVTHWVTLPAARVVLADGHRPEWNAAVIAHARSLGVPLVLDAGSLNDSTRALAAVADHVVASETYARAALADRDPADPDADLASLGRPGATVVVTLGARGLAWQTPVARGLLPAPRIHAIDTNGAGDAFHGAYALGLALGLPLAEMLRQASAAGALSCTRAGAWPALPAATELAAFLNRPRPPRPA
ncbi:MAG: carbohydrate kinase [Burkholderiales bacterium]|nr:carbohydrate kinase [Opitutaceae bacterium]